MAELDLTGGMDEARGDIADLLGKEERKILTTGNAEIDKKIAGHVLSEICDGACIQLGIGGMPNALGKMIAESDLKNLGVHTEMLVDGFVEIAAAGVVNGSCKNIDRGRGMWNAVLY